MRPAIEPDVPCARWTPCRTSRSGPRRAWIAEPREVAAAPVAPRLCAARRRRSLAVAAILLRLPRSSPTASLVFDDGVFGVVGARDARGRACRSATSSRARAGVPPAGVGRRPRRVPHRSTRRACSRSPPACCSPSRCTRARRRRHDPRRRAARGRARHDERLGAVGHRAGERRRPVARAVGRSRSRSRSATATTRACATRCSSGSPAAPRCRSRPVGAGGRDRRADRAARRTAASRDARRRAAAGIAVGVYVVAALPWGIGRCGTSRTRTTQDAAPARAHVGDALREDRATRSGTATSLVVVALVLAGDRRSLVRVAVRRRRRSRRRRPARARGRRRASCSGSCSCSRCCSCGSRRCGGRTSRTSSPPLALLAALRPPPWRVLAGRRRRRRCRSSVASNAVDPLAATATTGDEAALVRHLADVRRPTR